MAAKNGVLPRQNGVIYGRQSKTKERSESVALQLKTCRTAAKNAKVKVVAEISEPPSTGAYKKRGTTRPRWPELLELVRTGAVQVVIAYKTDRLSRGGGPGWAPLWDAAEEAIENGAAIDLDRFILTPDGFKGEFELGIRAAMDREESKKTSERIRDMKEHHAATGRFSGSGYRPYGYERNGVTIIEAEAGVIREMVARYLAGQGFRELARWLNAAEIPTTTGAVGKWQPASVYNLLGNARISGQRVHRGKVVGDAEWPGIIDRPTWDRLKARMDSNARGPGQGTSKYLLQNIATCKLCGGKVTGAPTMGRPRYRCQKHPGRINCGGLTIACAEVDEMVEQMVLYRLESPAVVDALAGRTEPVAGQEDLSEQILGYESRLEQAAMMFAEGELDQKGLVQIRHKIGAQLETLRAKVANTESRLTLKTFLRDGKDLAAMWEGLDQSRKREILRAVIDRVEIDRATKRGSTVVDLDRVEVIWKV